MTKHQELVSLVSNEQINANTLVEISEFLEKMGIEAYIYNKDIYSLEECQKLILEKGTTYVLSLMRLTEAVLPKMADKHKYILVEILRNKLSAMSASTSLIIVDPYLFPTNLNDEADFLQMFQDIIDPFIGNMK